MVSDGIRWYCMVFDGILLLNSIHWYSMVLHGIADGWDGWMDLRVGGGIEHLTVLIRREAQQTLDQHDDHHHESRY